MTTEITDTFIPIPIPEYVTTQWDVNRTKYYSVFHRCFYLDAQTNSYTRGVISNIKRVWKNNNCNSTVLRLIFKRVNVSLKNTTEGFEKKKNTEYSIIRLALMALSGGENARLFRS